MFRVVACSLALAVVSPVVLADQKNGAEEQPTASATAQPQPADEGRGEVSSTQSFVMDAHMDNLFEIKAAQLAQGKSQDAEIKRLAQMLVTDHQKADRELQEIAKGMGAKLDDRLDQLHQMKLQKMQKCASAAFDRKYVIGQTAGHTMDVLEFTYQSQHAENDQVKQFAMQTLPTLERHLQEAKRLAKIQVGGDDQARPAAAHVGDNTDAGGDRAADPAASRSNRSGDRTK